MTATIKRRIEMEKRIVRKVVRDLIGAGYKLNVNNGGDSSELPLPSAIAREVLKVMFATDDEWLLVYKDVAPLGETRIGWVRFIYGNDGYDVMADWTMNLESALAGAMTLADKYVNE